MLWTIRRTVLCLMVLAAGASWASAEEEAELETRRVALERRLSRYRTPPPVAGPNLGTPADLIAQNADVMWNGDPADERLGWLTFAAPALDRTALAAGELGELFECFHEAARFEVPEAGRVVVWVPESVRATAAASLDWLIQSMTPSVLVDARLERTAPESRLRAVGQAQLWPGRWMSVFFQKDEIPSVVDYDIEVAQEATAADPIVANLVEGCELYLRYHPGESRSLVEVWIADVEHVEVQRIDLSEIRNVPEGNAFGVLNAPTTAIDRAFGCIVLPAGETVEREIVWTRKGRAQRLALRLRAPAAGLPRAVGDENQHVLALMRTGAATAALEFKARALDDEWQDPLREAYVEEPSIATLSGEELATVRSEKAVIDKVLNNWKQREVGLIEHTVTVDLWRVPEAAYRAALDASSVQIGAAVSREVLAAFEQAGGESHQSIRKPVLDQTRSGFRVGESVPGLIDIDVEIAQQAAGMSPRSWALFRGVFADVTVSRDGAQTVAHVAGEIVWADTAAGTAELVFRPPVSMKPATDGQKREADHRRRAKMPLLSGGSATFDAQLPLAAAGPTLMHVAVRGEQVTLLLVSATTRR